MTYSKYQQFMIDQGIEFIKEIHPDQNIPEIYKNEDQEGISLEDLERLDNKYIEE